MPKRLKRSVAYYRRSTKKQEASIEDQRTLVQAYAAKHGYEIVDEYIDDGISGDDTEKRVSFLQMRDDAARGLFDYIICWDQDRFGRFDSLDAGYYIKPIRDAGVQLVTLNDGLIDWDSYLGRLTYSLKQEGKNEYLKDLSGNVMRGIVEAAKKGSWHGTPPYGYSVTGPPKNKKLEVDHVKAATVKRIFDEFVNQDRAMNAIAKRLTNDGVPTPRNGTKWLQSTIRVILENPAYVGTFRFNSNSSSKYHVYRDGEIVKGGHRGKNDERHWIVKENNHEAVVDKRTWNKAQKRLSSGTKTQTRYAPEDNPYLFSGKLRCGVCGANMHGERNHSNKRMFYECGRRDDDVESCTGTKVYQDDLIKYMSTEIDERFGKHLVRRFAGFRKGAEQRLARIPKDIMDTLRGLLLPPQRPKANQVSVKKKLAQLNAKIGRARDNLIHIDGAKNIAAAQRQISEMETAVADLERQLVPEPTEPEIRQAARVLLNRLAGLAGGDETTVRQVLREIDHIVIHSVRRGKHANGLRYHFRSGELHFAQVGPANSRVNSHRSV